MARNRDSRVRLGIVGLGGITEVAHMPSIVRSKKARLVAVCDIDKVRADKFADKWKAPNVYYDMEEMVQREDIDAIIVAIPTRHHRQAVEVAARAKKHILCEKPLATNLTDGESMIAVCRENRVSLQVGFSERFWNQSEIAKLLIAEGVIGTVYGYNATWNEKWGLFPAATDYRYDLELSGGASILDLAIHRIDLARFLVGEIVRVCADIRHVAIPYKVDDNVWILCNFANGGSGCISANRFSPGVSNPVEIYGTEGMLFLSLESFNPFHAVPMAVFTQKRPSELPDILNQYYYPRNYWDKLGEDWISITPERQSNFLKQIEAFCDCVLESQEPKVTGEDGLKALEVVMAAYQSVNEKGWVSLPLEQRVVDLPKY